MSDTQPIPIKTESGTASEISNMQFDSGAASGAQSNEITPPVHPTIKQDRLESTSNTGSRGGSKAQSPAPDTKREAKSATPKLPDASEFGPVHEYVGGSSLRRYLNEHVTKELMQGLKQVARERPEDPLRWLGEYLIERSNETKQ